MRIHTLKQEQVIPATLNEAWEFFSNPQNLSLLTPLYLNLKPLNTGTLPAIYAGMKISYRVSPVLGIPLEWITEITEVRDHRSFTDMQLKGPYQLWRHRHELVESEKGVLMKDHVDYALPLSVIGELGHWLFVKAQLREIFKYRRQRITDLFPEQ